MASSTNETESIEVVVCPPQGAESDCEGKPDDLLSQITKVSLQKYGELEDMNTRQRVEVLTIKHGWRLPEVQKALGVSQQAINKHWQNICEELDFDDVPKRMRAVVARQFDAQYERACRMNDDTRGIPIALKALELKAKLLGLNLEAQTAGGDITPYKTPDEIAESVRAQVLAIHGRSELIEAIPAKEA